MARKRAPKGPERKPPSTPVSLSPADRLEAWTQAWFAAVEKDKRELKSEIKRLRPFVAENARLREALSNAETNSVVATSLIAIGGFLVSYATFTGLAASAWANVAAGCLVSGIVLMLHQMFRHWRRG